MQQGPFEPQQQPFDTQKPPISLPEALKQGASPFVIANSGGWESSPIIVRSWAHTWAFLMMWLFALVGVLGMLGPETVTERIGRLVVCLLIFLLFLWQRKAFKRGVMSAWWLQMPLSILGLIWFPIGTLIHGYVLSQWFKPEVKAWFR